MIELHCELRIGIILYGIYFPGYYCSIPPKIQFFSSIIRDKYVLDLNFSLYQFLSHFRLHLKKSYCLIQASNFVLFQFLIFRFSPHPPYPLMFYLVGNFLFKYRITIFRYHDYFFVSFYRKEHLSSI